MKIFLSKYITPVGKTYYPGVKYSNKFYTTGTRVYHCIKLKQHIPKHIYQFSRYLRVRYDDQPEDQQQQQQNLPNITEPTDDTPDIQEQETEDTRDIQEQETDDTPDIQEQETSQPQPQEIKKTQKFDFNEYLQLTTAKIKKAQSLQQLPTETKQTKKNNTEH